MSGDVTQDRRVALTERQWRYIRHWVILVVLCEVVMMVYSASLDVIYGIIALLFSGRLFLRTVRCYPGANEPLYLDGSAVAISLFYLFLARLAGESWIRFTLLFTSSVIILPHLIYIVSHRDI
ncbi:MAG: hypothetical protein JW844_03190 [Candidatus Omnitrophica bacterium]|nr:hypothetical protein [Candidatus Omnitrophota bacterium]